MHKNKLHSFLKYLPLIYLAGVVVVSLIPFGGVSQEMNKVFVLSLRLDYLLHALIFVPMFPLWRWGWPRHAAWMVYVFGVLIAAAMEGSHYIIPYRAFNINDLLANIVGVHLGILLYLVIKKCCHSFFQKEVF